MLSYIPPQSFNSLFWCSVQCGHMVEQEVMRDQLSETNEVKVSAPVCERESRFAQVKRIIAGKIHTAITANHSSVQNNIVNHTSTMCNSTIHEAGCEETKPITEVKPRKRKERHESIGSITQERKVVS